MTISQEKQNPISAIITRTSTLTTKTKFDETKLPIVLLAVVELLQIVEATSFAHLSLRRISHKVAPNRPDLARAHPPAASSATPAYAKSNSVPILKRSVSIPLPFTAAVWYASHIT